MLIVRLAELKAITSMTMRQEASPDLRGGICSWSDERCLERAASRHRAAHEGP